MTGPHDAGFCRAVSQKNSMVTTYINGNAILKIPRQDGDFICTQDPGHEKSHAACDGQGHILARWSRRSVERYWQPGDCDGCDHEHPEAAS